MPRFNAEVRGGDVLDVVQALKAKGLQPRGSFSADDPQVGRLVQVELDADSAEAAEARVRELLPAEVDYRVHVQGVVEDRPHD